MCKITVGEIIKVKVIGFQNYGIFVKLFDDESYSGLIHISELSYDFVKDVSSFANINDILYAKVLDVDNQTKHVKLSIKATKPYNKHQSKYVKIEKSGIGSDFSKLKEKLPDWIEKELKEKHGND